MERDAEIRSFKVRRGRTGPTSQEALARLWPRYGLNPPYTPWTTRPLALEIGFGMGEATATMAAADPATDVLAVDVHPAGIAALLRRIETARLDNVRVVEGDALEVLAALPAGSVSEVRVFFPDPWPKARHAKRRLLRPGFAALVATALTEAGRLHLATDWDAYADHAVAVLTPSYDVEVVPRPEGRPSTPYERRGLAAGRSITDVVAVPVRR